MASLAQDLRFALQTHRKGRLVALFAIISLALGIAGNVVVFSLVNTLIFKPLPYPEPDRIVLLGQRERGFPALAIFSITSSFSIWEDYRTQSRTLIDWAAFSPTTLSRSLETHSVSVRAARVTPSFFRLLGAGTVRGRIFADEEGVEGGPKLTLLSWSYWQTAFAADNDPTGRVITLDGEPHEVVGVLAENFEFMMPVDLWMPLQQDPRSLSRGSRTVVSIARMAAGTTMEQVDAEVAAIAERIEAEYPEAFRGWTMDPMNFRTEIPDPSSRLYMAIIQGAVLFVLLIACVNITNLLVARGRDRAAEIAIRTALGAQRLSIVLQLVRESMIMAALGGVAGLGLAAIGIATIARRLGPWTPRMWQPSLDVNVVVFTTGVTVVCGLMFGLFPALQSFRASQFEALKHGAAGSATSQRRGRAAAALVVAEIALSLVALGGGSVLAQSFLELLNRDPGFESDDLLTVAVKAPYWKYTGAADEPPLYALFEEVQRRVAALPGVVSAAFVHPLPKTLFVSRSAFRIEGQPPPEGAAPQAVSLTASPDYLETLRTPLLRGRFFEATDEAGAPPVAVVNRELAERRFGTRNPVGERIVFRGKSRRIIGVAANVQQSLTPLPGGGAAEAVYIPLAQSPRVDARLVVRTSGEDTTLAELIRTEIGNIDPDVTIAAIETMNDYTGRYTVVVDVFTRILGGFGILALLLASLGTYGVVAYTVGQRTHEIGVRMAMGAEARQVVRMIALEGIKLSALGLVIGAALLLPVTTLIGRVQESFALAPLDPLTLLAVGFMLFVVTAIASIVPATRASSVDPMLVLKTD